MPAEADYNVADGMFKNGAAGRRRPPREPRAVRDPPTDRRGRVIINGDWTLGAYVELFGDKLNVCPIPQVTGADWPTPYARWRVLHALQGRCQ